MPIHHPCEIILSPLEMPTFYSLSQDSEWFLSTKQMNQRHSSTLCEDTLIQIVSFLSDRDMWEGIRCVNRRFRTMCTSEWFIQYFHRQWWKERMGPSTIDNPSFSLLQPKYVTGFVEEKGELSSTLSLMWKTYWQR